MSQELRFRAPGVAAAGSPARVLAQHQARLEYAVRVAGIGFWYCDLPLDELIWDAQVREHFGFDADRRVTIQDFYAALHPDDREPTRVAIETAIRDRHPYDIVYRTVGPSGQTKWIRAVGGAQYEEGEPTHFDGVTVDVTAQMLYEQHLVTLNERLQEEDHRKDEFLATLAHELRNPLAPLRTGLELLKRTTDSDALARTRDMMQRQLMHLVRLVDDLLDISRITSRKITLNRKRLDLREVVQSAQEATDALIRERNHRLETRFPAAPLIVEGDPVRLAQVFSNLLNNAARYTEPGGRITLSASRANELAVIQVNDNGAGIEAHMIDAVFGMFVQAQASRQAQSGLGIGLTLVRRLVEMHGGSVNATSEGAGRGSTFTVSLPLSIMAEEPVTYSVKKEGSQTASRRILIVDDNVDAAESLALLLESDGHVTQMAHGGLEALEQAKAFRPDLVILDIGLPGLNGHEVARRLRASPDMVPNLKLVALTGWGSQEDRQKAEAAGFDVHLVKPVEPDRLRTVVLMT